jgi:hypothetical protein
VNLTERDRKVVIVVVPLVVVIGFWFLLLGPKRTEASKAADSLAKQEQKRDKAQAAVTAAEASKASFAKDYTTLVKLGKAVPTKVDLPTVIVQLEAAAKGTGTEFVKIATGQRAPAAAAAPAPAQPPAAPGQGNGSQPAAAGGAPAASAPGGAVESAGNSVNNTNGASATTEKSGVSPSDSQTSTSSGGGLPVGGGAPGAAAPGGAAAGGAPGLESVPLDLEFQASFFKLADFFHSLKRFVQVANNRISVRGRLLTVDSLSFKSDPELFPKLHAEVKATVYLTPEGEGVTAGATPQGPAATPAAAGTAPAPPAPTPAATPTATATP